ncbi:uncharacterized protein LOC119833716 [Zerene cesonia]|uniref:uncharacterized protein LOC119833716 n=1 Tax=Zerene cesonia TaxID=33412 RepID=UPI0018E54EF5|nr:uncharacterized protein LOC119833716 [Zerene cesonia]
MHIILTVFVYALCVSADESEERRSKLPFIADAVGNKIPRPSSVPATVGSPVNLLTPDRYEFYTFDESGELVKRLMTLEEIQAIVAAGEDTDSLVTFANDDRPTIAFNFSEPPYTKVHNVVTNVQNVLKAQMEAHKNNPHLQPTFDTPDVSDSWSLILPSIFGNTGVDIVPEKTSNSFITPETDTIDIDNSNGDYLYAFSKEASNPSHSTVSTESADQSKITSTANQNSKTTPVTTENFATSKPIVSTTSPNISPLITTEKVKESSFSTVKPPSTVTTKVFTNKYSTNANIITSPTDISNPTGIYINGEKNTEKIELTTQVTKTMGGIIDNQDTVFVPISTVTYITERSTKKPTKISSSKPSSSTTLHTTVESGIFLNNNSEAVLTSTHKPQSTSELIPASSSKNPEYDHNNLTTITTQSVSPSTTMSSTEIIPSSHDGMNENVYTKVEDQLPPLFDVAQSISQIASDLGSNLEPLPTTSNMLDANKYNHNNIDIESKENIEIEIPQDTEKANVSDYGNNTISDNYVKVTMLDHSKNTEQNVEKNDEDSSKIQIAEDSTSPTTLSPTELTTVADIEVTTIDPILSESMGDLMSQVVYHNDDIKLPEISVGVKENNKDYQDVTTSIRGTNEIDITTTEMPIEDIITSTETNDISKNEDKKAVLKENVQTSVVKKEISSTTERINKSDDTPTFVPISSSAHDTLLNNTASSINISDYKYINTRVATRPQVPLSEKSDKKQNSNSQTSLFNSQNKTNTSTHTAQSNKKIAVSTLNKNITSYDNKINTVKNIASNENKLNVNKNIASNENKISATENKKVENKLNKLSDIPKMDEFKKKIQKINIDDKELANERNNSWKLIPTVPPPKPHSEVGHKYKPEGFYTPENNADKNILLDFSKENQGLEVTTKDLSEDISQFVELCNKLAFQYWNDISGHIDKKRSFVFSPYAITSMLTMMFMGARGATSGEMNEILKLDDMVTFNPHFTLKNISDSIDISPASGVAVSAFIREIYSDRSKGKILTFYKERAQQFYNGHVEEVNFKLISDIIRRRTNLLVKRYTYGKIIEYMKTNSIVMQPPLAAFSTNIFETDCSGSTVDGRDGEMYFVVSPNVRQRRLVPVPAVVFRSNFLAGYDPVLDATAAALGNTNSVISTLFLMPGQQGNIVHADDLEALEKRLLDSSSSTPAWNRLLRTLLPRVGLELQIPRFSHKSIFNVSSSLKKMGLKDLFDSEHADLAGINGPSKNLYLSDMIQVNSFVTCGESVIGEQHHIEEYPESLEIVEKVQKRRSSRWLNWDEPRDYQRAFHDPHDVGEAMHLPLHLRPRQARLPARNAQPARLKFDRPFLYFVRHNPSGMILYVGRYNPRLLP